ncbi:MAG: alanine--tRNA ligase-related protein, partial [Polyangia bacterium]|nr:alanine--tRNA ligase-related protein [Polyangia bacterium]
YLVLYESPFYAESGGQVGDTGLVVAPGFRFVVRDTQRVGDLIVHHGDLEEADLAALPERVTARVDLERRRRIMANHTATHLLHAALKTVVSKEANQKGSLVHPDYLRFDFTHDAALTGAELEAIERMVNQRIAENHPLSIGEDEYQEAISKGVTALFGEKYGDRVRVVRVPEVSAELCGGTHCRATGDIGLFQILSERAISAGVRRIVAETRDAALGRVQEGRRLLQETARLLGVPPEQLPARVEKLALDLRELKKGAKKAAQTDLGALRKALLGEAPVEGGVRLVFRHLPELDGDQAAQLADAFRSGEEPVAGVLVAGAAGDRPPALVAFATKDLGKRVNATELVRAVGKGGGRPDFAKGAAAAGDPAALEAALARACDDLRAKLR